MLVTPLLDAGAIPPLDAGATADAKGLVNLAPDAAVQSAPRDKPRRRKKPKPEMGRLAVKTSPYSVVFHQGRKLGTTPMANLPLPPGRYRLVFKNPNVGSVSKTAVIRSGKTTKLDFALEP